MSVSSFPAPFIQSLQGLLGEEAPDLLNALQQPAPASIRYNTPSNPQAGADTCAVPWCAAGRYLNERPVFTLDPLFHAGRYYVQEASSMFLEQIAPLIPSLGSHCRVLDLCAAPGGKTTHLAGLLPPDALLVSNEVIRSRAAIVVENLSKWGVANSVITNSDPKAFGALPGFFDLVLVDAPCSGEGLFRKDFAAVGQWSPDSVRLCSERQRRIVADAWNCLRSDGLLVYSTCTFNRHENEDNIDWIKQHLGAEQVHIPLHPLWRVEESDAGYRFYPHRLRGEGFFISILRKTAHSNRCVVNGTRCSVLGEPLVDRHLPLTEYQVPFTVYRSAVGAHESLVSALPTAHLPAIAQLKQCLIVLQAGLPVGMRKGADFIPAAALAFSPHLRREAFHTEEVDLHTALRFLRKDPVTFAHKEKGFFLLTYRHTPLGFVKQLGHRSNNLYPTHWRIRRSIVDG